MQQFVAAPPAQNPLVASFASRMAAAPGIPEARRPALAAEAEKVVASHVYPAWKRAIAVVQPLEAKATDDAGLWRFKDGAAVYAETLRRFTTTTLTAEEIHQIGLNEVARIEKEMDAILRTLGRTQGSVKDRVEQLKKDLSYPLTEDGRTQIMAQVDGILRDAEKRAVSQFDRGRRRRSSRGPSSGSRKPTPPPTTPRRRATDPVRASSRSRCVPSG